MVEIKQTGQTWSHPRPGRPDKASYRVAWTHRETGLVQVGRMTFASYRAAADFARAMDALWPEVPHWVVGHRSASDAVRSPTDAAPAGCTTNH